MCCSTWNTPLCWYGADGIIEWVALNRCSVYSAAQVFHSQTKPFFLIGHKWLRFVYYWKEQQLSRGKPTAQQICMKGVSFFFVHIIRCCTRVQIGAVWLISAFVFHFNPRSAQGMRKKEAHGHMSTSMTDPLNHKISYFTRSDLLHVCCIRLFWQVNGNLMSIYTAGWEALLQEYMQ